MSKVLLYLNRSRFDRIVVSLCCGACETELHAPSNTLMVCLDISQACISAASTNYSLSQKDNLILAKFDMKHTSDLLNGITNGVRKMGIVLYAAVLFQHPSPAITKSIRSAFSACTAALRAGIFSSVFIVYDSKPGGNCWSRDSVVASFLANDLLVSEEMIMQTGDGRTVMHPAIGCIIPRVGWALMKSASLKAKEVALEVKLRQI